MAHRYSNHILDLSGKRAYTEAEAATYLSVSRSFLRQARMHGNRKGRTSAPPFIRIGSRAIRYLREDLDGWLEQFREDP